MKKNEYENDYITLYLFESGDHRVILFLVALDRMQFPTHTTLSAVLRRMLCHLMI